MDLFSQVPIYIYTLSDPRTGFVRYVGKTKNLKKRQSDHLHPKKSSKKEEWIRLLQSGGFSPIFNIIDECTIVDGSEKEKQYIKIFKSFGADLCNYTKGGENGSLGHIRPQHEKDNINEKMKLLTKTTKISEKTGIVYHLIQSGLLRYKKEHGIR